MIFSDLVCFCSLDTGQEIYDLGDFSVLVRQNTEMTLIKLKLGNGKPQNFQAPGSGEQHKTNVVA